MNDTDDSPEGQTSDTVRAWLSEIDRAEKEFDEYDKRCATIKKKYLYEGSKKASKRKYQMLWANIEVLKPSIYARCPEPIVQSRFKTGDPVSRVACMLLERGLDFQFDVCDYDSAFKACRDDYLLYGRGVPRLRYEPTFEQSEIQSGEDGADASGKEDAEDEVSDEPAETLSFETVKLDFVNRKDFVHPFARRWEELPWLAYRAFLTRAECVKRFGKKVGGAIPLTSREERDDDRKSKSNNSEKEKATLYEIWDKEGKKVIWIAKGYFDVLEEDDPYLKLDGFYPSPKPIYGTITTDSLIPTPDYVFYQDQAEEIDDLTARIGSLTDALKLVGFYPAGPQGEGAPEIERAVQPGFENKMVAVKTWDIFREAGKGGAPIIWLPVEQVVTVIEACVKLRKELIDDVFQITGIADIMRGDTDPNETAAAQGQKAEWGSVRLKERQKEIARMARDVTRMAAEIIANHFQVSTLCEIANMPLPTEQQVQMMQAEFQQKMAAFQMQQQNAAAAQPVPGQAPTGHTPVSNGAPSPQPTPAPANGPPGQAAGGQGAAPGAAPPGAAPAQQPAQPAPQAPQWQDPGPTQEQVEQLLRNKVMRRFAVNIEADSTIAADEKADQERRTEFIAEAGKFITGMLPVIQAEPMAAPFIGALFLFGIRGFPVARELEAEAEKMIDKLTAAAGQPKPPNPEDLKAQAEVQKAKIGMQTEQMRAQAEVQKAKLDTDASVREFQMDQAQHQMDIEHMNREHSLSMAQNNAKQQSLAQTVQIQEQRNAAKAAVGMFNPAQPRR